MRTFLTPLALCLCISARTQPFLADTLLRQLEVEKTDTNRVLLFGKLSRAYLYFKPDTALIMAQQGLALSNKIGFVRGQAICTKATGSIFSVNGNYAGALALQLNALKKFESINDEEGIGSALVSIAVNYSYQGDYREALNYSFRAKAIAEKRQNEFNILVNISNIGETYEKMDMLDSARFYIQQAYEISLRRKDNVGTGIALNNLGNVYNKINQPSLALEYYRASIPYQEKGKFEEGICETSLNMAKIFQSRGNPDSAIYYAQISYENANHEKFTSKLLDASQFLSAFYKSKNKLDSAFAYQEKMIAAKDSMFSQEKVKQVQNLSFTEMLRQQEISEERAKAQEERRNNLQLLGSAVFIISFFLFIVLLSRIKTKPRIIEVFGVIALLLLFEFISLYIHPFISRWEHDNPVFMLLTLVGIAAFLVPLHHKLEDLIKHKLAKRISHK